MENRNENQNFMHQNKLYSSIKTTNGTQFIIKVVAGEHRKTTVTVYFEYRPVVSYSNSVATISARKP